MRTDEARPARRAPTPTSIARETLFWILAVVSVGAALAMILVRRAVHCALMLAVVMLCLATMYAMQGAPFLAFVQIIVYTGAVLMLFLFVLMLIGISSADSIVETIKGQRMAAGLAAIGLFVVLVLGIGHAAIGPAARPSAANGADNLTGLADLIFTTYVFPFEVTGALLITAALGAMVLAHRERTGPEAHPAGTGRPAAGQRPAGAGPVARRLRAARRRGPAGPAAGRQHVGSVGQPDAVASVRWAKHPSSFGRKRRWRSRRKAASGSPPPIPAPPSGRADS